MIEVCNHRHRPVREPDGARAVYIGRPSPLGNPLIIGRDGSRADVIEGYASWLTKQIAAKDPAVMQALNDIASIAAYQVKLYCWCAPEACHGDVIKATVEGYLDTQTWAVRR